MHSHTHTLNEVPVSVRTEGDRVFIEAPVQAIAMLKPIFVPKKPIFFFNAAAEHPHPVDGSLFFAKYADCRVELVSATHVVEAIRFWSVMP